MHSNTLVLFFCILLQFDRESYAKPQFLPSTGTDSLPPLPPSHTSNDQIPDRAAVQFQPVQPGFSSPFDPPVQQVSNSNWRNNVNGWPAVRQQPLDSLNQGMQKEVWNQWMPDGNYGIHVASRPDFGRGGFLAARSLLSPQQLING